MSVVPGLGVIPERWKSERARWLLHRQRRDVSPTDGIVTAFRDGQVTLRENRRTDGFTNAVQEIGYQGVRAGDLVVHSMDGFAGAIGVSDSDGKSSPVVHAYLTNEYMEVRFVAYVLRTMAVNGYVSTLSKGIRERSTAFDAATLADILLPVPPLNEQRRIADFLDAETTRIDRLSTLQSAALAMLNEREAAMLDLAIDELIERAGTRPLRRYIRSVGQGSSPQCDAVPAEEGEWGVLKVSCLRPGEFFPGENKRLPDESAADANSEVHEGDLLITRANTPQLVGSTAVVGPVRARLLLSDKIFRVRLEETILAEFVATVARGSRIRALCSAGSNGASQSMANIRFEEVKAWPMPAVGLSEQAAFVDQLQTGRASVERFRPVIKRQLELLAERQQALITAALTGQFDVSSASGRGVEE